MRTTLSILRWGGLILCSCIITNLLIIVVDQYPGDSYLRRGESYPLSVDCEQIRPGMDLPSALTTLVRHDEPSSEALDENKLKVERGLTTCIVTFDEATKRARGVQVEMYAGPGWEKKGI
jgi:hypothetical protein